MTERGHYHLEDSDRLSAYLDGRMDGEETRAVAAHLLGCDACRREYDALVATKGALSALATAPVPPNPDFWQNAYRTARLSQPPPSRWSGRLTLTPVSRLVGSMTAFVALALVLLLPAALHQPGTRAPVGANMADAQETLDVSDLVRSHAQYAATQPLADNSRLSMVLSEEAARREAADTDHALAPDGSGADDGFVPGTVLDATGLSN